MKPGTGVTSCTEKNLNINEGKEEENHSFSSLPHFGASFLPKENKNEHLPIFTTFWCHLPSLLFPDHEKRNN